MSISIKQIAKDLNLAVSTVSKALRDSYEISEETKRMVLEYARKVNYIPNPYAGSLTNRTTRNIAVVVPEVADTFFSNAINGIDSVAQVRGYHVIVYLTHESSEREVSILNEFRGGRVDGVLISVAGGADKNIAIHKALAEHLPVIFFDRICEAVETAKVVTDDFTAAYNATIHLISRGCRKIVMLAPAPQLSITEQRKGGFKKAFEDSGLKWHDYHFIACSEDEAESRETIRNVLKRTRKVDGIVASVEKLAMQAYAICNEQKIVIPKDVKVIAFSNIQIAPLLAPPLTTIEQPAFEMGKTAATLLFGALAKKINLKKERVTIPSVLRERESTAG